MQGGCEALESLVLRSSKAVREKRPMKDGAAFWASSPDPRLGCRLLSCAVAMTLLARSNWEWRALASEGIAAGEAPSSNHAKRTKQAPVGRRVGLRGCSANQVRAPGCYGAQIVRDDLKMPPWGCRFDCP